MNKKVNNGINDNVEIKYIWFTFKFILFILIINGILDLSKQQ